MPQRLHLTEREFEATVEVDGHNVTFVGVVDPFVVRPEEDGRSVVSHRETSIRGAAAVSGDVVWVSVDGEAFEIRLSASARRNTDAEAGTLSPPMPATVVRVAVTAGQSVSRGDLLVALEAMKMELSVRAPRDGVIRAVHCREGELVQPGTRLLEIE